jgi:hypothetical protein
LDPHFPLRAIASSSASSSSRISFSCCDLQPALRRQPVAELTLRVLAMFDVFNSTS